MPRYSIGTQQPKGPQPYSFPLPLLRTSSRVSPHSQFNHLSSFTYKYTSINNPYHEAKWHQHCLSIIIIVIRGSGFTLLDPLPARQILYYFILTNVSCVVESYLKIYFLFFSSSRCSLAFLPSVPLPSPITSFYSTNDDSKLLCVFILRRRSRDWGPLFKFWVNIHLKNEKNSFA